MTTRVTDKSPVNSDWLSTDFEKGLVSVVVPTFNRSELLRKTLESILSQTYRPIEIIVVDDGSTDDTPSIVQQLSASNHDTSIQYIRQSPSGAPAARNNGMRASRGEFICITDDDDLYSQHLIESRLRKYRELAGNVDIVYGPWQAFRENSSGCWGSACRDDRPIHATNGLLAELFNGWVWPCQGWLMTRAFARRIGPWDESLHRSQDLDYKVRAIQASPRIAHTADGVLWYRKHANSISMRTARSGFNSMYEVLCRIDDSIRSSTKHNDELKHDFSVFLAKISLAFYAGGHIRLGTKVLEMSKSHSCRGIRALRPALQIAYVLGGPNTAGVVESLGHHILKAWRSPRDCTVPLRNFPLAK